LAEIFDVAFDGAGDLNLAWLAAVVEELGSRLLAQVRPLVRGTVGLAVAVVLGMFLTIFFLRDGPAWWQGVVARIRPRPQEHVDRAGRQAMSVLSSYVVGTAIISLFGAITSGLIMVVLGLPLAIPIAVLTFFGSFIPYIGAAVATALAFLVAVALGTTTDIVVMAAFTVIFNIVQGNLVTPLVYGRGLRLHPAVVLMAIPVGGAVAGILGMFIAVPIVAMVAATWRLVIAAIADRPDPAPHPGPAPDRPDPAPAPGDSPHPASGPAEGR
jgi:predicted PurR-regulated permease PerM